MFIELLKVETHDSLGRKHIHEAGRCLCDQCGTEFTRRNHDWSKCITTPQTPTFCKPPCSREARKKNGISETRLRKKNLERYGVEYTLQLPEIQEKSKQTCVKKYGVEKPLQCETFKRQVIDTCLSKYGVSSAFHIPEIAQNYDRNDMNCKRIKTMKIRGTTISSKPEKQMHQMLINKFGNEYVETQIRIPDTHWIIDFYVKSINTFIQSDGVYWHGLNVNRNTLIESTNPRDQKRIRAWNIDRRQELWFKEQNMHLLRITDLAIKNLKELPEDLSSIAYFRC